MTADVGLGEKRAGNQAYNQENRTHQVVEPSAPDEGWWAAVLADEPMVEEIPGVDEVPPGHDMAVDSGDEGETSPVVDWEKVERIFQNDEIIALNVIGHNRGGVLVSGEEIHGFVPVSHLVNIPANLSEEEREPHLADYLDKSIDLKVIECEREKKRVVFSERAALAKEGQRKKLLHDLTEGDVVSGVVTNVTSFGAFVDLGGLEGLIHISELSWGRVNHPSDFLKVDDEIKTMVINVLEDEGRIALSLKRLQENPWESLAAKLSPGDVISAKISNIVRYGAFAEIEGGVEGLIHISTMDIPDIYSRIDDFLYEGQQVKVRILNIDATNRRLGLKLESHTLDYDSQ